MLIANTGQSLVVMNLRTGEQVQLPPGQRTSLDDSKIQYIDDSFVLISLFNAGVLVAYTDAGAAYPGFPTTANPADSKRIPPVDAEYAAAVVGAANVGRLQASQVLTQRNGVIYCNGASVREIGVCAYQQLIDYLSDSNQNFLTQLPLIAQSGFRFVRVLGGPIYPNGWNSTYGTDKAAYFAKIKQFLDVAAANRLGVILSVFWRHATQADIVGETISTAYGSASSLMRVRCRAIATEYAQQFSGHPALAAWEVGNEYSLFAANSSIPVASAGNGTPASYASPADLLSLENMRAFYVEFAQTIQAVDTSGRLILTGNGGPGGVIEKNLTNYQTLIPLDNPDPINTISYHRYSRNSFGARDYGFLFDELSAIKAQAKTLRKPLILGEFGMEEQETYGGYGGEETFRTACDAIYRSGVQLALAWNWNLNNTSAANNFDFHPGNTTTGMDEHVRTLKEYNDRMRAEGGAVGLDQEPAQPILRGGQNIYVPPAGLAVLLTAADNAALKPTAFSVSLWVKITRGDLTNRRIVRKYGGNSGWYIGIDASSPNRTVFMQVQYTDGTTQNLAGQALGINVDEWRHYTFVFNATAGQATSGLTIFENGTWVKTLAVSKTWNPSTDPLYVFGDSGPSNVSYCGIRDLRLMNRPLTDKEVRDLYLYDIEPSGVYTTTGGRWPFNGALTDTSGNGNNLSVSSGTVVYESFTK